MPTVGIPRGLLYYHYSPLWRLFLEGLGVKVIESGNTNAATVLQGLQGTVDEACLPVKVFFGHVEELKGQVDYLFVPRLVSVEPRAYICPKLMGLPDMLRHSLRDLPPLLDPTVDLSKSRRGLLKSLAEVAHSLGVHPLKAWISFLQARWKWQHWQRLQRQGLTPGEAEVILGGGAFNLNKGEKRDLTVGLIGHPYLLYDDFINLGSIKRLRELGAEVRTPEMLSQGLIAAWAQRQPKRSFWTLGKHILGAAGHYINSGEVDGIIHFVSFGCGPDSLVGELVQRQARRGEGFPFLLLTLDEHSGEVGLTTRLEAFIDTLKWRKKSEGYLSPHG